MKTTLGFFNHIANRTRDFTGHEWIFAEIDGSSPPWAARRQ